LKAQFLRHRVLCSAAKPRCRRDVNRQNRHRPRRGSAAPMLTLFEAVSLQRRPQVGTRAKRDCPVFFG